MSALVAAAAAASVLTPIISLQFEGHEQLLGVHYDSASSEESLLDAQGRTLMKIKYEKNGILAAEWTARSDDGNGIKCSVDYDR